MARNFTAVFDPPVTHLMMLGLGLLADNYAPTVEKEAMQVVHLSSQSQYKEKASFGSSNIQPMTK